MATPAWLATLSVLAAGPALAAAGFSLDERASQLNLEVKAGIAYLGTGTGAGPLNSLVLQPDRLALEGSGGEEKQDLFWFTRLNATWLLQQTYAVQQEGIDTVFQSSGALALKVQSFDCNGPVCGTSQGLGFNSLNTQQFIFTLDADAAFSANGNSGLGQLVSLNRLDAATGVWLPDWQSGWNTGATYGGTPLIGEQVQRPWSLTGTLLAGTYRLANSPDVYTRYETGADRPWDAFYNWDYSLRLSNTTLLAQPVPEPGAWALMLAGLAALGWRAARRPG